MPSDAHVPIAITLLVVASLSTPASLAADGPADVDEGPKDVRVVTGAGTVSGSALLVNRIVCTVAGVAQVQAVQDASGVWNATYTLAASCISYQDDCTASSTTASRLSFDCEFADRLVLDGVGSDQPAAATGFDLVIHDPVFNGRIDGRMTGADVQPSALDGA